MCGYYLYQLQFRAVLKHLCHAHLGDHLRPLQIGNRVAEPYGVVFV